MNTSTEEETELASRARHLGSLGLALVVALAVGCERTPTNPEAAQMPAITGQDASASSSAMMNSKAPFRAWHQGFQHGTEGWITDDVPGAPGWCGDITRVGRSGSVEPSAGRAYATVEWGGCNTFWQGAGFPASGPFSPGAGFSSRWPASGFVYELDVYLDPDLQGIGSSFTLAASLHVPGSAPPVFHYLMVPVDGSGDAVTVMGDEVGGTGWHTFHVRFGQRDGHPTAELELRDGGSVVVTHEFDETAGGTELSDLEVAELGSGYLWFTYLPEGLALPIDEHRVRRGR